MCKYIVTGWRRNGRDLEPVQFAIEEDHVYCRDDVENLYKIADGLMEDEMKKMEGAVVFVDNITVWKKGEVSIVKINR